MNATYCISYNILLVDTKKHPQMPVKRLGKRAMKWEGEILKDRGGGGGIREIKEPSNRYQQ